MGGRVLERLLALGGGGHERWDGGLDERFCSVEVHGEWELLRRCTGIEDQPAA